VFKNLLNKRGVFLVIIVLILLLVSGYAPRRLGISATLRDKLRNFNLNRTERFFFHNSSPQSASGKSRSASFDNADSRVIPA
jgi:Lhr-like helicase